MKRIKESELVYSSLRSEILLVEEMQRNMYLYMYSIFAVLYVLGVQFGHIFFLITFVVLIPFQSKINFYSWSITKMSVYIRVFFEETGNTIHWESFQTYPKHLQLYGHKNNSVWGFVSRVNTALLGILAAASFIIEEVKNFVHVSSKSEVIISILLIVLSIILAIWAWIITKQSFARTDIETFEIIDQYKRDLESGHTVKEYRLDNPSNNWRQLDLASRLGRPDPEQLVALRLTPNDGKSTCYDIGRFRPDPNTGRKLWWHGTRGRNDPVRLKKRYDILWCPVDEG